MLSYCQSGLYLYPSLVICPIYTYVVSILQRIMRTCKIRFKSKHHQYRYPNKFDYITNRVSTVTCNYFFSVLQVGHTCISLQIQQECFSMYELWHQKLYQISVNIPQFSKTCHLRWQFCANHFSSICLTRLRTILTTGVNDLVCSNYNIKFKTVWSWRLLFISFES